MACYRLEVKKSARKSLLALPRAVVQAISQIIDSLADNPYPAGCKKLSGTDHSRFGRENGDSSQTERPDRLTKPIG